MKQIEIYPFIVKKRIEKSDSQGFLADYTVVYALPIQNKWDLSDIKVGEKVIVNPIAYENPKTAYANSSMGYCYTSFECVKLQPYIMEKDSENNPIKVAELYLTESTSPVIFQNN